MTRKSSLEGKNYLAVNLRYLIRQARVSQNQLAKITKVNQPTIHRILSGQNTNPRDRTKTALANYFKVSVDDLCFVDLTQPNEMPPHLRGFRVPLLRARDATKEGVPKGWPDVINVIYEVTEQAFAMIVEDDGLRPDINKGDIVVIEKHDESRLGQLSSQIVAARLDSDPYAIVRRFKTTSYVKGSPVYLLESNPATGFGIVDPSTNKLAILGKVVARWELK